MNKRGAAWMAKRWLDALTGRLPRAAVARLMRNAMIQSRSHLHGDFDRRTVGAVVPKLRALGFDTVSLAALLEVEAPSDDDRDALVLSVQSLGGAAGSYHHLWVAQDRQTLCTMAPWLEDPAAWSPDQLELDEILELHVVKSGRIVRTLDLWDHVTIDGRSKAGWRGGAPAVPRRVTIDWRAMRLPRATKKSVRRGDEIAVRGWEEADEEASIRLRYGPNHA
jgi:hypothetical protein